MTKRLRQVRRDHGDAGSALVMALLFVSMFGLVTAALLTFGFAGERTQQVVTGSRDQRYAADGAIDGAIKRFQRMQADGVTNPCAVGGDPFFTYTVHSKTAHVSCTNSYLGGTPNPPQSLLATVAASTDFYPYNTTTSASLTDTTHYLEATGGTGTVAKTDYVHPGASTISFSGYQTDILQPPQGGIFQQVQATVSHKEGDGPGCCPSQDQWLTVSYVEGGSTVQCGAYPLRDWRATGGPAWPSPPYEVIDVTYKPGMAGNLAGACLNTPARIQSAVVTFNAQNNTCGGRTISGVSTTAGSTTITSTSGNFTGNDVVSPRASVAAVGNPNFLQANTKLASVTNATTAVLDRAATATVTNRSVTIGTVCGTVNATIDGVGLCVCLSSRPTQAASTIPACDPTVGQDDAWQVNHGNLQLGNKDCTQGNGSNPKDGIFAVGDPTLVGGSTCISATCGQNTHSRWQAYEADATHALQLSNWTFDAVSTVDFVSLRVSHVEEAANMAITVTMTFPGSNCAPFTVPTNNAAPLKYVADQILLPDGCAPKTAAQMAGLVMTYAVTCTAIPDNHGVPACKPGVKPYAFLDAIVLDLDYQLGGTGGTPVANFVSIAGQTTVTTDAQFNTDGSVALDNYQVS
jgi:hypothetical protein